MTQATRRTAPWFFWPFAALWDFLAFILRATGRLVGALLGFTLMVVGLVATATVVAAPVGIPLVLLGFLLMLRSLF